MGIAMLKKACLSKISAAVTLLMIIFTLSLRNLEQMDAPWMAGEGGGPDICGDSHMDGVYEGIPFHKSTGPR